MWRDVEPKENQYFPLILSEGKRIFYESGKRQFFVNGKPSKIELTVRQDQMFVEFLQHPNEIRPYLLFYHIFFPGDETKWPSSSYKMGETLRWYLGRLRDRLREVNETLPGIIHSVRAKGLVYRPHESLTNLPEGFPLKPFA